MASPLPSNDQTNPTITHHDGTTNTQSPSIVIPPRSLVSVEHPCIIKNVDKGIQSLGGEHNLSKFLASNEDGHALGVSLRPDDPFAKKLPSTTVQTMNVLLKVTVPKRTGRRRKKGSSGPFLPIDPSGGSGPSSTSNPYVKAADVFRSLQDNVSKYTVTPVGIIEDTHRFRSLPDLQYSVSGNKMAQDIKDALLPMNLTALKTYDLNTKPGITLGPDIGPPPFINSGIPYNYMYRQNPLVKYTVDTEGETEVINIGKNVPKGALYVLPPNIATAPTSVKSSAPPEESLTEYQKSVLAMIRAELEQRPVISRHVLNNKVGWDKLVRIWDASCYCGYHFDSGPFKDDLIKFGVDPRLDPEYRKYQTISYLVFYSKEKNIQAKYNLRQRAAKLLSAEQLAKSHYFDGVTVSQTGNMFQVCDITDPVLHQILATSNIRSTCSVKPNGWYHPITWAKARIVLREKAKALMEGRSPAVSEFRCLLALPDSATEEGGPLATAEELKARAEGRLTQQELNMIKEARQMARQPNFRTIPQPGRKGMGGNRVSGFTSQATPGDTVNLEEIEDLDWEESEGFFDTDEDEEEEDEEEGSDVDPEDEQVRPPTEEVEDQGLEGLEEDEEVLEGLLDQEEDSEEDEEDWPYGFPNAMEPSLPTLDYDDQSGQGAGGS